MERLVFLLLAMLVALAPAIVEAAPRRADTPAVATPPSGDVDDATLDHYAPLDDRERAAVIAGFGSDSPEMAAFLAIAVPGGIEGTFDESPTHVAKAAAFQVVRALLEARVEADPSAARPVVLQAYAWEAHWLAIVGAEDWPGRGPVRLCLPGSVHERAIHERPSAARNVAALYREALRRAGSLPHGGRADPDVRYAADRLRAITAALDAARPADRAACEAEAAAEAERRAKMLVEFRAELARMAALVPSRRSCPAAAKAVWTAGFITDRARPILEDGDAKEAEAMLAFVTETTASLEAAACP